jgi:hypothetical protein
VLKRKPDVQVTGSMGFYQFHVRTARAWRWVERKVQLDAWQISGQSFVCDDTRMAQDIAAAMQRAGFEVR